MTISSIDLAALAGADAFVIRGESGGDEAGYSVAWAGDVNKDGFDDILIGAPFAANDSTGDTDTGKAYVVFGSATGIAGPIQLSSIAAGTGGFMIRGESNLDQAGITVAAAGDLNGDGFADIAIGATSADGPGDVRTAAGAVYVVYGAASFAAPVNLSTIAAGTGGFVIHGAAAGDHAGAAIAAGDVNGDGLSDLLIGAPTADGAGAGFVVFGTGAPVSTPVDLNDVAGGIGGFKLPSPTAGFSGGVRVATGDVNGDGIADMVIGASGGDRAYVVDGLTGLDGSTRPLASAGIAFGGATILGQDDETGAGVAVLGDVNGDGIGDFAVSAPSASGGAGQTYVIFGGAMGLPATIKLGDIAADGGQGFLIQGQGLADASGFSVSAAGDINGDGLDDVLIGAKGAASAGDARLGAGETYVLLGSAAPFGAQVNVNDLAAGNGGFVILGADGGDASGTSVAGGGDLNGDGFADLLIGAPTADGTKNGVPNSGETFVLYGRDFAGTVTKLGDSASNLLEGTAAADSLVGGQGPDALLGKGGVDAIYGGNGDDAISIADATFRRVDGGRGTDTLVLDGPGMVLDLTQGIGLRVRGIETIDMLGGSNHVVKVSERAIDALSDTSNTITIEADAGDLIDLGPEEWVLTVPEEDLYKFYTRNNVTLRITGDAVVACFAEGSRIATTRGEVAVEALREGDIALLAEGGQAPIRWIGHRATNLARHPRPWDVQPVRVAAHAFGPGLPASDLRLSPDHAVFAAGRLVPVRYLINGATIAQEAADAVTYFHVELAAPDGTPTHGVVLAQGLPVESFLDTGNRGAFANGGASLQMHPDFALRAWEAKACARLLTQGPALAELRAALLAQAHALGFATETDADPHLLADGRRIEVDWREGDTLGFVLPEGTREVRLVSRTMAPAWMLPGSADHRRLGVAVAALAIDGEPVPLDASALATGWHASETDWRWTDGDAPLPAAGACLVELRLAPIGRYWQPHAGLSRAA